MYKQISQCTRLRIRLRTAARVSPRLGLRTRSAAAISAA